MSRRERARPFDLLSTPLERGTTVIEASAGTGKTYCLTGLVLRLLLERRVDDIGQILVVTFTNAATDELVGRIRGALRDAQAALAGRVESSEPFVRGLVERYGGERAGEGAEILRHALLDFDEMLVSTIHGFCKRVLEENAFESGSIFDPELLESDETLRLDAARDAWRRLLVQDADGLLAQLATARGLTPEYFAAEVQEVSRHPDTAVWPRASSVEDALASLAAARERLAGGWRAAKVRLFLSRRSWRSKASLADVQEQRRALAAVDSFCRGDGGVEGLEALSPAAVAGQMRDPADELAAEPSFAAVDAVLVAADRLEHAARSHMLDEVSTTLQSAKERGGVLAFDDLLHRLDGALRDPRHGPRLRRAVRESLRVALVDEFQDTDLVQYRIFRDLFRHGPLFLVGDPKQAIYRFRGADVFAYLTAQRDADRIYTLGHNWRSSGRLVRAVGSLFECERPFVLPQIPFVHVEAAETVRDRALRGDGDGDDGRPLQIHWLGEETSARRAEARLVEWTAAQVAELLAANLRLTGDDCPDGGRPLRPADLAVLVRTNQQAQAVQEGLRRVGVPAVVSRSGDVFHTDEMEELERLLRAILDPSDRGRLEAACATLLWGSDAGELARLAESDDEAAAAAGDGPSWQQLYETFDALRAIWRNDGFVAMTRRWLGGSWLGAHSRQPTGPESVRERLLRLERGERRLTNLLHGIEVLARAIHDLRLTPAGLVAWLAVERRRVAHDRDATELRLESDAEAVEIATVHKAKGLEYEVVLCPFLWQARPVDAPPVTVHAATDRVVRVYDAEGMDDTTEGVRASDTRREVDRYVAMAEAERLAEDLRLLYVAVTRARRRCLLAWGAIGRGTASSASALAYLLHRRQGRLDDATTDEARDAAWTAAALQETRSRAASWEQDLRRWAGEHADLVELRIIDDAVAARWRAEEASDGDLAARPLPAEVLARLRPWQIASFTSLSREPVGSSGGSSIGPLGASPAGELPDRADPALPTADGELAGPPEPARGIFAFARGPRAGQCLHDILERLDFPHAASPEHRQDVESLVEAQLRRFGLFEAEHHGRQSSEGPGETATLDPPRDVVDLLGRLVRVQLPDEDGPSPRLADVGREARLTEWQFWAPLRAVSGHDLAACFRRHGRAPWASAYADRLETLTARDVRGFLTGFIDLAFVHHDRWYVVDWKSNHLGNRRGDYGQPAMARAMEEHHYFLQYHLYVVALMRFLASRGDGRAYDEAFGGVYYVFLRGLGEIERASGSGQLGLFADSDTGETTGGDEPGVVSPATGVFADRPPVELVEALDSVLFEARKEAA